MEITNAIKTITQAAGKKDKNVAEALKISPAAYSKFFKGDFSQITRIIEICELCGCQLQITNNNGLTITLEAENKKAPE